MNYTLFIDESGDFETFNGEWVIGAILIEGSKKIVNEKFSSFPKKLKEKDLPLNKNEYHLTELRKNLGNTEALLVAEKLFASLHKNNFKYKFLVVRNEHKVSLSQRERTYRTMLRDLLSITDCSVPIGKTIESLDLVVATRTIDGDIQTTFADICSDILDYIPKETEYDLATLGLINLINKNKLTVELLQANKSWGLICADFISNLTFHYNKAGSQELLDKLYVSSRLQFFDGIGDYKIRRAKIAASNGDYILSCKRWISFVVENLNKDSIYSYCLKEITKLVHLIINEGRSSNGIFSLLSIEESLWRSFENYEKRIFALQVLETAICNLDNDFVLKTIIPLFKLRNLLLLSLNHVGDTDAALKIVEIQEKSFCCKQYRYDPDFFSLFLDFKRIQSEIYVNLLDFEQAFLYISEYHRLVENYSQVFSLIENDNNENFSKSNVWIKCESSYLRIVSLFGIQEAGENIESYTSKINKLKTNNLSSFELSRLDNMLLVVLIKSRKFKSAIEFLKSRNVNTENCSEFDIYTELLCYYFVLKSGEILEKACLDRIHNIEQLLSSDCSINKNKHPIESIYLILALISWHQKNVKDARSYITKAKKSFCLKSSNVSITIFKCITIAEYIIFSNDSLLKKDKLNKDELNKYIDLIIGI